VSAGSSTSTTGVYPRRALILEGGLPQNVNFGIDAPILKKMLDSNSILYEEGSSFLAL